MEAQLTCFLCKQYYTSINPARLLTMCGHSYCQFCLKQQIKKKKNGRYQITCPQDNHSIQLIANNVCFFPKNVSLMKVIDLKNAFHNDSTLKNSNGFKQQTCDQSFNGSQNQFIKLMVSPSHQSFLNHNRQRILSSLIQPSLSMLDVQMCLLHQKQLDVVCIEDATRICANCAIFGSHKGHSFKRVEQIQHQAKKSCKQIYSIIQSKKNAEKRMNNDEVQKQIWSLFGQKKDKMKKQVLQGYRRAYQSLKQNQKQNLQKLDDSIHLAQKKIKDLLKFDQNILKQFSKWEASSLMKNKVLIGQSVQQKLQLLFGPNAVIQSIIQKGNDLIKSIKSQQASFVTKMQDILEKVSVKISFDALNHINKYITVDHTLSPDYILKIPSKRNVNNQPSQQLLLEDSGFQTTRKNIPIKLRLSSQGNQISPFRKVLSTHKSSQNLIFSSTLGHHRSPTKWTSPNKRRENQSTLPTSQKNIQENIRYSNMSTSAKRKSKLKIPQQFTKTLQGLMKNDSEVIDFTNAELGDQCIIQLCEMLGSKAKTVKLIRNKLTDQGLKNIIPYLKNVSVLNLSQNFLTERSLQILLKSQNDLKQLKSIVISQNKIFQRKYRDKIDKIKQIGITVSI